MTTITAPEEAILRTVIYADIFDFPPNFAELHHFLISGEPTSPAQVERTLTTSPLLRGALELHEGYVVCAGRSDLIALRHSREQASMRLWPLALQYGVWLARLPFVRMVALTGALAVRNVSDRDDDLDYVLVTASGRVWLARAFAILLVRLAKLRGVVVCPNYVLAESALAQDKRDLFMAHEVAQMIPIFGHTVYEAMRAANPWADAYLPNADCPFYPVDERQPEGVWSLLKRGVEAVLGGRLGDRLETWEYRRKLRRFAPEMRTPNSAAVLDDQHVKGHFNDHGHPALRQYDERLREYDALPLTGE